MMEKKFKALFLNKEGKSANDQGIETDGHDEFYYVITAVINLTEVESYYETKNLYKGKTILNVRTKSGDEWSLLTTMNEMWDLKKTSDFFSN